MTFQHKFEPIWYPIPGKSGLTLNDGGAKGVLHTTEPPGALGGPPPFGWYGTSGFVPGLTCDLGRFTWYQHIELNLGSYTLFDQPGGIVTNRDGRPLIQIEIMAHALTIAEDFGDAHWEWLGQTLRQLSDLTGIPWLFPLPFVPYPASYGINARQRMTGTEFRAFSGWCGHQHVPENEHGDPGAIPVPAIYKAGLYTSPSKEKKIMKLICIAGHDQIRPDNQNAPVFLTDGVTVRYLTGAAYADAIGLGYIDGSIGYTLDGKTINTGTDSAGQPLIRRVDRTFVEGLLGRPLVNGEFTLIF
jgi:hypothetical protein